jgi:hypothetical protein
MPIAWVELGSAALGAGASVYSANKNAKTAEAGQNQSGTQSGTQTGTQTSSSTTGLNPAISQTLGFNGGGILGGLAGSLDQHNLLPYVGKDFINNNAESILYNGLGTTNGMIKNPYQFPTIEAAQIAAPSQNGINLSPTFQSLLSGGNTSALMQSLKSGNDLTNAQFQQNTGNATDALMKTVLPSIRSNSVLAGQYGGSRQGVAEGNAISDYTKQLTNGATQVGLANSANTSGQIANDYQQGQGRALSAAQSLSGQQYSTAAADAAARQAGDNTNVNSLLTTNALNSSNKIAGIGMQQNLIGNASNYANTDLTRLGMASGILSPFTNAGATVNSTNNSTNATTNATTGNVSQPLYQNTAGNALGGALAGSQLASMLGNGSSGTPDYSAIRNSDGSGFGNYFNITPSSLNNMKGSTSSSIYGPSSGGSTDWGSISSLFNGS